WGCFVYAALACGLLFWVPFKLNKKLREIFFARFAFPVGMYLMRDRMIGVRRQTISQLNDLESHDDTLKKEGSIRVLEIGAGFGANLEHMQRKVKYWNLDPNAEFGGGFRENLKKNPNVELERWIRAYAEDMRGVPDGHFDVVLVSYVLCSVSDVGKVLSECKRVLSKGGRLVFVEHVAHPEGSWGLVVQKLLDPLWAFTFCGCHVTRRTGLILKNAGFAQVELNEAFLPIATTLSAHVYGFAVTETK
ncbi:conserved hypothetical protein, partial [Ixodes scapularis]